MVHKTKAVFFVLGVLLRALNIFFFIWNHPACAHVKNASFVARWQRHHAGLTLAETARPQASVGDG
eukprot:3365078-Amphidinium_carterae.1